MRRYIFIYIIIITLLTGCTVQNSTAPIDTSPTYTQDSTSLQSSSPSTEKTDLPNKPIPQASGKNTELETIDGKYTKIEVDGGDLSGTRKPLVVVDIGYGSREYWAYTNEYSQLVRVTAKKIVLQNAASEPVLKGGRYYTDEAKVPGTEREDLDQGHVIADSLGGVSNAYNITPQNSVLNRHGDQAYMEKVIRDAGGCTDFEAIITYPNTKTQIPSHYKYTYTIKGNKITDEFDNVNPDEVNKSLNTAQETNDTPKPSTTDEQKKLDAIDKNKNGKVSIAEAKAAGYKMPITKEHWLYKYMDDRDGDGLVGE